MRVVAVVGFAVAYLSSLSAADKAAYASGIESIQQHVGSLQLSSKSRAGGLGYGNKLYVEHLLKGMEELDPTNNPDERTALDTVINYMDQILALLATDKTTADAALVALADVMSACTDSSEEAAITNANADTANARAAFDTCLVSEDALVDDDDIKCSAALATINDLVSNPLICDPIQDGTALTENLALFAEWNTWFTTVVGDVQSKSNTLSTQASECTTSGSLRAEKVAECNTLQLLLETAACNEYSTASSYCTSYTTCYDNAAAAFDSAVVAATDASTERLSDANMIHYIKCLVDNLLNNANTDLVSWQNACAAEQNTQYPEYGTTIPTRPTADDCNNNIPSPIPGDAAFKSGLNSGGLNVLLSDPPSCPVV
jgi:hypothetical protein